MDSHHLFDFSNLSISDCPPLPPVLRRTKRFSRELNECKMCHYHCDDIDELGACTTCTLNNYHKQCRLMRSHSEPILHQFNNVVKELALAARVLPNYVNSVLSPTDFRPSRIKRYGTYYSHLIAPPPSPLVGIELNPGPACDWCGTATTSFYQLINPEWTIWIFCNLNCMKRFINAQIRQIDLTLDELPDNHPILVGVELNPGPPTYVNSKVEFVSCMGSDITVVNAARVSFNKQVSELTNADEKLIAYLAKHNHWTPFSHPQITFRIKIPIFVARQWYKHTIGFTRNEMSRRYVTSEPEFYNCEEWRKKADNVKQGSSDSVIEDWLPNEAYKSICSHSFSHYHTLLSCNVCPEQARMVLPQCTMTEFYETGSLYAYARLCNLRLDSHAQKEIRDVASLISDRLHLLFPISWHCLCNAVPAPPLVGIELNPGPSYRRWVVDIQTYGQDYCHITTPDREIALEIIDLLSNTLKTKKYTDYSISVKHASIDTPDPPLVGVEKNPGPRVPFAPANPGLPKHYRMHMRGSGRFNEVMDELLFLYQTCDCGKRTYTSWCCCDYTKYHVLHSILLAVCILLIINSL